MERIMTKRTRPKIDARDDCVLGQAIGSYGTPASDAARSAPWRLRDQAAGYSSGQPANRELLPGRRVVDGNDGRLPGAGGTINGSDSNVAEDEVGQDEKTKHDKPLQSPQGQAEGEAPAAARTGIITS